MKNLTDGAKEDSCGGSALNAGLGQWISVNDRLPINDYEVVFVLLNDLRLGITFSYDDAKSAADDKNVDICICRDFEKWLCAQGTYDLDKIKSWMSIPKEHPNKTN